MQLLKNNNELVLNLSGDYLGYDDNAVKNKLWRMLDDKKLEKIVIEGEELKQWDSTLLAVIYNLEQVATKQGLKIEYKDFPQNLERLVKLAALVDRKPEKNKEVREPFFERIGTKALNSWAGIKKATAFIRKVFHSVEKLCCGRAVMRKVDWLFALEDCSYKALGIVSLISFMVGLILAFVGAIQLKAFGAQIYVASLVAIGMTRIMGAIMVGIVMAGRTGASYAATIGTMQVNEEIDALKTMGIPTSDFLVLPRITALTLTMPLLTILSDIMGILGGATVGIIMLGIQPEEYWLYSYDALDMTNFLVGLFHALVFGVIISICGCYYGMNCGRNADSVGKATTQAVVASIIWMITATGIITLFFEVLGI